MIGSPFDSNQWAIALLSDVEDVSETLEMLFANMDPIGQAVW